MKSYWIVTKGDKATLERREVPVPQPKAGEVLVRVQASALNRGELTVGGVMHGGPEKLGGNEFSGVVHAVGEGVTRYQGRRPHHGARARRLGGIRRSWTRRRCCRCRRT